MENFWSWDWDCPIIIQAFVNMAVALQVFPVTGQTLPLISSGGTATWMTCIAFGMILSVSAGQKIESNTRRILKTKTTIL